MSITQGTFPNELKIARVIPLYKGEDTQLIENYWPFQFYLISQKYVYTNGSTCNWIFRRKQHYLWIPIYLSKKKSFNKSCDHYPDRESNYSSGDRQICSWCFLRFEESIWHYWSYYITEKTRILWHKRQHTELVYKLFIFQKSVCRLQ